MSNENNRDYDEMTAEEIPEDDVAVKSDEEQGEVLPPDTEIIGVRFRKNGKIYYFDPKGMSFAEDSHAIVETVRGIEYGTVAVANRQVGNERVVSPLRPVIRAATAEDDARHAENTQKEVDAFNVCLSKIDDHKLAMKLVDAEYTFDRSKLLFYFTADGRVDFRELVKDLAGVFRTRIELRQIGIRDEAKLMGGLGICGRPFCCHSFLDDFVQVSIKMAKEQSLSLNANKISGACGRLMCCLRYEYEIYDEAIKHLPKVDQMVETPDGEALVTEINPLAGTLKAKPLQYHDQPPKQYSGEDVKVCGNKHDWNEKLAEQIAAEESARPQRKERPLRERIIAKPGQRRASFDAPAVDAVPTVDAVTAVDAVTTVDAVNAVTAEEADIAKDAREQKLPDAVEENGSGEAAVSGQTAEGDRAERTERTDRSERTDRGGRNDRRQRDGSRGNRQGRGDRRNGQDRQNGERSERSIASERGAADEGSAPADPAAASGDGERQNQNRPPRGDRGRRGGQGERRQRTNGNTTANGESNGDAGRSERDPAPAAEKPQSEGGEGEKPQGQNGQKRQGQGQGGYYKNHHRYGGRGHGGRGGQNNGGGQPSGGEKHDAQ